MTAIAVVVLGAAIVGLIAGGLSRSRMETHRARHSVDSGKADSWASGVLGPSVTLLALFLALVLAEAVSSFSQAVSAARSEATVINRLYHTAGYLEEPYRLRLQRSALCYARAVAGPEWKAMADGGTSSVPVVWTATGRNGLRRSFREMGAEHALFGTLTGADQARADARRTRLTQASPSIPGIEIAFLIAVIAAVVLYHALTSPPRSGLHAAATALAAATMIAALGLIHTLDRPFSGAIEIEPTHMHRTAQELSKDFVGQFGNERVRCDREGKPPGPRAS